MLSYYSQQLSSVEINYTFRRFPTEKSLTAWREQAADGFVFTLKANQRITHFKRLADADEDVRALPRPREAPRRQARVRAVPMPPLAPLRPGLIEAFVGYLRPDRRGSRWSSATPRGRGAGPAASQGVAWCVAETDEKDPARGPVVGAGRLPPSAEDRVHGRGAPGVGRPDPARRSRRAPTSSATSSTRTRARARQMAKRLEDILRSKA